MRRASWLGFLIDLRRLGRRWAGPATLVATSVGMLLWSWEKWPDVLIDFGAQLYLGWQLAEGQALYADLAHFKGPLSPYVNALWFRLFGVGLHTLVLCNLGLLVLLIVLLYRTLSKISDRLTTTMACLIFITIFAFGQLVGIGNYNYVCPYSHEVTHGLVLSLVALSCFSRYLTRQRLLSLAGCGVSLGLVFLTDASIFLALGLALGAGLGLATWVAQGARGRLRRVWGVFVGSAMMAPGGACFLLSLVMPMNEAFWGTLGSWPYLLSGKGSSMPFYQYWMGTTDLHTSLKELGMWTGWYVAIFGPAAILGLVQRTPGTARRGMSVVVLFLALGGLLLRQYSWPMSWVDAGKPLPLIMLIFAVLFFVTSVKQRVVPERSVQSILRLTLVVFALALMGKILLNVHTYHYGFALAMPATLLLVVALLDWVPAWIMKTGGDGGLFRLVSMAVLLVAVIAHLQIFKFWFSRKVYSVGHGADAFLADARGIVVNTAIAELAKRVRDNETVAVFPEGAMLNYLIRRANPTPYLSLLPFSIALLGEERLLVSLQAHPPDYIVLAHKDTSEEGFRFFGRDYGQQLYAWIQTHYQAVRLIGAPPLQDDRFGMLLLRRADVNDTDAHTLPATVEPSL